MTSPASPPPISAASGEAASPSAPPLPSPDAPASGRRRGPIPPRRLIAPALFVLALFGWLMWQRADPAASRPDLWRVSGPTMGTAYNVKVATRSAPPDLTSAAIEAAIHGCLDDVNARMSTYLPDSELSRFNDNPSTAPVSASAPLLEVVAEAQRVSDLSGGAFDVTVGPLVDAWGFGPADRPSAPPSPQTLDALRASVGYAKLRLGPGTLQKDHPKLRVDLSAIAKGYAVDVCAERLDALGAADYMVEVGGEVRARGVNARGEPWRIGIERPSPDPNQPVQRVIALQDASLATSGDYRNYYELDGQRLSHTIDPRTGAPITHRLASVSVVSPRCMTADAFATALNVLGPDAGFALAQRLGLAALFLVRTDQGFEERATDAFSTLYPGNTP